MNRERVIGYAKDMGIELDSMALERLEILEHRLLRWNEHINLTAITDEDGIAVKHFADSLTVLTAAEFAGGAKVVDVGCGAGFPGVPLAIAVPEARVTLLDSLQKRVNWLKTVLPQLEVPADCVAARAEEYVAQHREQFDLVTSRAVARLNVLAELCLPYVRVGGRFLALKGAMAQEEADEANHAVAALGGKLSGIREYPVDDAVHRIVVVEKVRPTPAAYPRKFAKIKQNPL